MKRNYKLKLFTALIIASISIGGATAFNPKPTSTTIITENSDNWVEVQNEDGVKIFLKEEILPEGRFISIKFENSSDKEFSFSWKLIQNEKTVQQSSSAVILKPNSSEIFFDPTVMIKLKANDSINQFSITKIIN